MRLTVEDMGKDFAAKDKFTAKLVSNEAVSEPGSPGAAPVSDLTLRGGNCGQGALLLFATVGAEQGQGCEMKGSGEVCFLCSILIVG